MEPSPGATLDDILGYMTMLHDSMINFNEIMIWSVSLLLGAILGLVFLKGLIPND